MIEGSRFSLKSFTTGEIKNRYTKRTSRKARQSHVWPFLVSQNIYLTTIIYSFAFGHLYTVVPLETLHYFFMNL